MQRASALLPCVCCCKERERVNWSGRDGAGIKTLSCFHDKGGGNAGIDRSAKVMPYSIKHHHRRHPFTITLIQSIFKSFSCLSPVACQSLPSSLLPVALGQQQAHTHPHDEEETLGPPRACTGRIRCAATTRRPVRLLEGVEAFHPFPHRRKRESCCCVPSANMTGLQPPPLHHLPAITTFPSSTLYP